MTLLCRAERIKRETPDGADALARARASNPKAKLHVELPDFLLFALRGAWATYNGGFGKAYRLSGDEYSAE